MQTVTLDTPADIEAFAKRRCECSISPAKTALVTGASGGIGGAIAKALHAQGATVVLSGTRAEALEALKAELGARAFIAACNLSDTASVEALPKAAEAAAGAPIDILVNNAGITRDNLFMRMKDEEWDQVIAVNLTAAFRLSRAVLRGMMKKRWGRIIQITSVVGATGNPGQGNYAAAKAGLVGMTKSLAAEVASPQHHRQLPWRRASSQTAMTDVLTDAAEADHRQPHPRGPHGHAGGNRRRGGLSGLRGSRLCHRRNHSYQWRDGDDLDRKFNGLTAKWRGRGDCVTEPATHEAPKSVKQ